MKRPFASSVFLSPFRAAHCPRQRRRLFLAGAALLVAGPLTAVTLNDLQSDAKMNAKRFASHFESFDFEPHDEVQSPDVFLASQKGDCDDYAILADFILKPRGFHTRLIHIRLVGLDAHAVCYVKENKGFLDYNLRMYVSSMERSGASLREIAEKVADMFQGNWSSVSEFTYTYAEDRKHMIATVVKTDPPSQDPDRQLRSR